MDASDAAPRGYIDPHSLREVWFHTGTACNLACPFCLEGSRPGDRRLERVSLDDVRPFVDEACALGVEKLAFTGGEPFLVRDLVPILAYALDRAPCLVLTNGVDAVAHRLPQLAPLRSKPHALSLRVSIDRLDEDSHDAGRGPGTWRKAWRSAQQLHAAGFRVSIARQLDPDEDAAAVDARYRAIGARFGLPPDFGITAFPDFGPPGATRDVPRITESCMTTHHTEATRRAFMCAYTKMVVRRRGRMRVYACTLVDDDPRFDQGGTLRESLGQRVLLEHHRCYACFRFGASCS